MSDPFANAEASIPAQANPADPFNGVEPDLDDPFATQDDIKGGSFAPSPTVEALLDRLVVMIPRKVKHDQPVPKEFAKTEGEVQDAYFVDLYVLGSEPLTFTVTRKGENGAPDTQEQVTITDLPASFPDKMIYQAALVGQLRRIDGGAKPILAGKVRRGPQAKDRGTKTFDSIQAEYAAWMQGMAKGVKGVEPKFSWQVDVDLSPAERQALSAWWASVRTTIAPLVKATDITGQKR